MHSHPVNPPIRRRLVGNHAPRVASDPELVEVTAAYGTRADLRERLDACLVFAQRAVEGADPAHPLWKVDLGQVSGYEKMMMEAGLFAHLVRRLGCYDDAVHGLARAIRANYDSTSALSCIMRHPRLAASIGTLMLVLERFGLATEQERAVVHGAMESPYIECSEHVPFRLLDRHWVRGLAGGADDPLGEALQLSAACRKTHAIYMTREDGYAITHAIMYATDFGARAVPPELHSDAAWDAIDTAVAWCTASGDHDLLVELLLAQLLLRGRLSAYGVIAWHRSRDAWDTLGFLPSPSLSAESFRALGDKGEERQYALHHMYHTVLVGGLLCAALLDARVSAPAAPAEDLPYEEPPTVAPAVERAVEHLRRALRVDPATARQAIAALDWTADGTRVEELSRVLVKCAAAPEAAKRMAIDGTIILAAQEYDLPLLAVALRHAARMNIGTTTVLAGADFLARQSLVSGAIGAGWLGSGAPNAEADAMASARAGAALANCLIHLGERLSPNRGISDA